MGGAMISGPQGFGDAHSDGFGERDMGGAMR